MRVAFCLYKYFPFGGLQRDFLRIALACQARGHTIRVYALEWRGDVPAGFDVQLVPVRALTNQRRYARFSGWIRDDLARRPVDRVVGFNKMPELDVYFAADPCFEDKARTLRHPLYRLSGRYRHFAAYERAVFARDSGTEILMLSPDMKQAISDNADVAEIRDLAYHEGMKPLRISGAMKVAAGVTTLAEVFKVAPPSERA